MKPRQTKGSKLVYTCNKCEKSMINSPETIELHNNKHCKPKKKK